MFQLAARAFTAAFTLSTITLVAGCDGSGDANDDVAGRGNSFPPAKNANDDFTSGSTGDSSNASGLARNEVRITMEVPEAVAPGGELTRRNLRIVEPETIRVYQTDQTLRELGSVDTRSRREDSGRTVIRFEDGLPIGPDVVIEATYGNSRMRALAADADRDVKVNPFSEYLVANSLDSYSSGEFSQIMDCVNDANSTLCLNKYVWATLADQVHDFEINIPGNLDVDGTLALLEERGDFARYVDAMADYALLGESSSGKIEASAANYHSVFWGVELGQTFLESSLASDIPYDRRALIHADGNEFFDRPAWDLNTHSSSPGAATVEDEIRLLAGRALYQSITGRGSSKIIGWTRNPYFLNAYVGGGTEQPDRVLSGYFSAGKAIELRSESGELKRERTLEDHYLSVFEMNLLREEGFERQTLDGRDYNVVYLSTRMGDESEPFVVEAGVGDWQISGPYVTQTMATTTLRRGNTGAVSVAVPADNPGQRDANWVISERQSRAYDPNTGNRIVSNGRLNLDRNDAAGLDEKPDVAVGASTPDGSLMAFNLDTSAIGNGLLVAAERANTSPPTQGRYRLQGAGLGMAQSSNRLAHVDNALLVIESSGSARLEGRRLDVVHQVDAESVSAPQAQSPGAISLSYSANNSGSATFNAGSLTLDGFFTSDQEQFFLQLRQTDGQEEVLGLVMATRLPE